MNKYSNLNHQKFFPEQEILHKIYNEKNLEEEEISRFIENYNTIDLLKIASSIRNKNNPKIITYSRKVFINLINLCKDSCSYCTYKK
jgi:FO synthase